jgi:hypothetical protein
MPHVTAAPAWLSEFAWEKLSRISLLALMLAACAGCTTGSRATSDTFRLLLERNVEATPAQVAANRFPQAQIRSKDISAVMVLGYVDAGRQAWFAGSHAVFYVDSRGLVSGTSGLGRTFETRILAPSPFDNLTTLTDEVAVAREFDWSTRYEMGVKVTGTLKRVRSERIEILGKPMDLTRFEESLVGDSIRATNLYWADPATGFIWKSKQYLAPGYAVELVQLKPYRPAAR